VTLPPGRTPAEEEEKEGRVGPFPSWRALYVTVILYTVATVAALYVLTRLLDHSAG